MSRQEQDTGQGATAIHDVVTEVESWIDRLTERPDEVGNVIERLTVLTLPPEPWNPGEAVNPLRGDLDAQFWFWNRAGGGYAGRGHFQAASEVWSAHYLACLSLQRRFHQRFHKGMPLCNIGFAFARAGRTRLAVKSWLLGVIEDTLTVGSTSTDTFNYQNLIKMKTAPAVLDQLIRTVESRFTDQSIIPMFPETVIELWLHPLMVAPSEACAHSIEMLIAQLDQSYPKLPDSLRPWEASLAPFWGFADWVDGVMNGG